MSKDKIFPTLTELEESLGIIGRLRDVIFATAMNDGISALIAWKCLTLSEPTGYILFWLNGIDRDLEAQRKQDEGEASE